jgi:DNA-binding NtrC family response regulator
MPVLSVADVKPKFPRRQPVRSILADVDRDQMIQALRETSGRVGGRDGAAARLGLKRTTFITRMKKLGVDPNQVSEREVDTADASDTADTPILQDFPPTSSAAE